MMSDDWFIGVEEVPFDSLPEGVLMATRKSDGEKISQMQDSRLSERSFDVMDPSTLDSKLLRDLSTQLIIMSASTVEDFRPEVFKKVLCVLYTHGMPNRSLDKRTLEGTHEDAKRITRELLLGIQRRIANGSLILTEEDEVLSDRDMQSVISDLLRLLEDQSIHPEPHDDPECLRQIRKEKKTKAVKCSFRRNWNRVKNTFSS
ncbi:uncharacterized protein LOC130559339 [Triplophysa rosa]|uniref:uncharacterized protein LOC130559339 n=1 Tax=Triplophysa rosa TaxID=992332 RepID=UPI002545F6B9|nr:uncharacterized protein LOC130559339 [Triplophysa rosa]